MTAEQRWAELPSGLRLAHIDHGGPDRPAVLFIPGYSDSCWSMLPLMRHFSAGFRLVALSQRGHGDSGALAGPYSVGMFADDLAAFMDVLGIGQATVIGHSLGSLVAMRLAIDRPERVSALGLLGAIRSVKGNADALALWHEAIADAPETMDSAFVKAFQSSTLARPVSRRFLDFVVEESLKMPGPVWTAILRGLLTEDFSDETAAITARTLFVWGEDEPFCPAADQAFLSSAVRRSESVVIPGAGHAMHWEDPAAVARLLLRFLEGEAALAA